MEPDRNKDDESASLQKLLVALGAGARAVHGLPLEDDFSFEAAFPEFAKSLSETQESLLETLLLALPYTLNHSRDSANGIDDALDLDSFQDIQDPLLWDACADACEELLDCVEAFLQSKTTIVDDDNVAMATGNLSDLAGIARHKAKSSMGRLVESTVDMEKPQVTYNMNVSSLNSRQEPFIPKVHPAKPFSLTLLDLTQQEGNGLENRYGPLRNNVRVPSDVVAPLTHVPHIYEQEIVSLDYRPRQLQAQKPEGDILVPVSLEAKWVETPEELIELARQLEKVQDVAIDLEHHSYRSFAGLLCLMQISFRNPNNPKEMQNFLVDTLAVRPEINEHLAPMFANPDIVKVMHGADSDIQWLQRDFGIYVVNLFDTGRAARALGLSSASLAFLLQKYVNLEADKTHQLSDWRQRPLPDTMRQYAIMDTHYLLDIYDRIKWDLDQSKSTSIHDVLDASKKVCLIRYAKDPFYPQGFKSLMKQRSGGKQQTLLNAQQEQVLEKLWDWRDQTARNTDESPAYIGSNSVLLRIALACPTTVTALQALLNPIPPLILHYATAVTQIVRKVRTNANMSSAAAASEAATSDGGEQRVGAPSSAFFKPAERASDDRLRRTGVLSPVLGTEALYKEAGWITPSGQREEDEVRRALIRRLVEEQEFQPMTSTTEEEVDSDAVDASGAPMMPSRPSKFLAVNHANKDYRTQPTSGHSLGMGRDAADGNNPASPGKPRARVVDGTGVARAAREHSHSPVPHLTVEDEVKSAQQTAALIRSSISQKEGMLGLISPPDDEEDLDAEEEAPRRTAGSSPEGDVDGIDRDLGAASGELEEEFVIPRSMREIYKISNRNRRNKKVASPTLDRPTFPTSDAELDHLAKAEQLLRERGLDGRGYFDDANRGVSPGGSKRQRTKSAGGEQDGVAPGSTETASREEDVLFMQEIGWVKNKEEADRLLLGQDDDLVYGGEAGPGNSDVAAGYGEEDNAAVADDDAGGAFIRGSRDSKTPTFDYSSVAALGVMTQPGASGSNPFFAGAATVGGPLTQGANGNKAERKKNAGAGRGGNKGRGRQERPEKRDGKTHAYRKR
jgi:exosome complex exonuclease RRP6